jgi:CDP-diacylglycerol--glycerol-3-phosphate 3-phosphatidyltransferase
MQSSLARGPSLPDIITISRIFAAVIICIILYILKVYTNNPSVNLILSWTSGVLFIIAAITDSIDGYLARKYNTISDFGKLLDPIADKVLVLSALVMLIPLGRVQAWVVVIFILREIVVTGVRGIAAAEGIIIQAESMGKLKTVFQSIALGALLIYHKVNLFGFLLDAKLIGNFTIYLALIVSVISGYSYIYNYAGKKRAK